MNTEQREGKEGMIKFMENKKELFIKIVCVCIVLIISVCLILFYNKNKEEDIIYDNFFETSNNENIMNLEKTEIEQQEAQEIKKIKVYITGEVNDPGVKELSEGARIEDIINLAGGLTELANIRNVNLAYEIEDGQKIYIPNINEAIENYISEENGEGIVEKDNKSFGKIDINKADLVMLCEIPGVGESLASKIIEYRKQNGKFKKIEDLKNVSGIGEKKFESLRDYIVVK